LIRYETIVGKLHIHKKDIFYIKERLHYNLKHNKQEIMPQMSLLFNI